MTMPPLPARGNTDWRDTWAQAVHAAATKVTNGAFVAGSVLNNNGTVNTQKKLTVKLTADGLDIEDLIIEDVA